MRHVLSVLAVVALAACQPTGMENQSGVGFQNYELYQRQQAYLAQREVQRRAAMAAAARPPEPPPVTTVAAAPSAASVTAPQSIASDAMTALGRPAAAPAPVPGEVPAATATAGAPLSAIASAPAIAPAPASPPAQAPTQAPTQAPAQAPVAPAPSTAAPPAPFSGSNIAAFALATSHPIGQQMYRRTNPLRQSGFARACARYPSDAMAQEAFLEAGGPERDRLNLDPDGDGFACAWDPAPFRLARQGG